MKANKLIQVFKVPIMQKRPRGPFTNDVIQEVAVYFCHKVQVNYFV